MKGRRFHAVLCVFIMAECQAGVHGTIKDLWSDLKDVEKFVMRKALPLMQDAIINVDIAPECSGAMFKLLQGAREQKAWALKFLTSNGGIPAAFLYFGTGSLGHYGQCVHSKYIPPTEGDPESAFTGKFCSMYLSGPPYLYEYGLNLTIANGDIPSDTDLPKTLDTEYLSMRMRFGLCLPSTCASEEVTALLTRLVSKYELQLEVRGCRTLADEDKRSAIYYIAISTLLVLMFVVALSTLSEINGWARPGDVGCMFSLRMNSKYLLAPVTEKRQALAFISGLKGLLAFWVVLGHTYFMIDPYTLYTLKEGMDNMKGVFAQIATNGGFLSVTTFFCISGFLLMYGLLSTSLVSSRPLPIVYMMIIIRRYLRLTLPSVAVILFAFVVPAWARGPTTDNFFRLFTETCSTNWWRAFTYTNNLVNIQRMCWYHYWFMSADMQIFVVMTVFALLILRAPKLVFICLGVCVALSCTWIIQTTENNDLTAAAFFDPEWGKFYGYLNMVYVKSLTHAGDFIFGMFAGILYSRAKQMRVSLRVRAVSSATCFVVLFCIMEAPLLVYLRVPVPRWAELLYAGFHRVIWCIACGWLFLLMATHNLRWLSNVLSCRVFVVLGRLSFGVYLVHVPIMTYFMGTNTTYVQMAHTNMVRTALGNYALSILLSYILHLLVEAPSIQLDCILFGSLGTLEKRAEAAAAAAELARDGKNSKDAMHVVKIDPSTKL